MNQENKSRAANPASEKRTNRENYNTAQALKASFSVFPGSFATAPTGKTTLEELALDLRRGRWQGNVEALRSMTQEDYSSKKRLLLAVSFGGIFSKRSKQTLLTPSGLVVIDIDHIDPTEMARIKGQLSADRHTALVFVSPSGTGLKAVFVADFSDDASFKQPYQAISSYLTASYGLKIDETGKDICRLCYVSYDPAAYLNPNAEKFVYEAPAETRPGAREAKRFDMSVHVDTYQQRYVLKAINGELERVAIAPKGTGNNSLNVAAMCIGQFYYLGLFVKESVKQLLVNAYLDRGGSFKNRAEAESTFESGWQTGLKNPRVLPERGQP